MKPINRFVTGLLLIAAILLPGSLRAESVGFPKDNPAFTVEVPSGWKAEYMATPNSLMLMDASLSNSFMAIAMGEDTEITGKTSASATLKKFLEKEMKENVANEEFSEPTELTIAGQKAYSIKATTKGGGPTNEFLVFTPDGETWFTGMTNGDVKAVIASIKAAE
jgi:hypothetical protein